MSDALREAVRVAAALMALAAKTAPKAKGVDNLVIMVVDDRETIEKIAAKMEELADEYGEFLRRDAHSLRNSDALLVIGAKVVDLGLKTPRRYRVDVNTVMALLNLGIAVGSAVKTASILSIDNRIMYSVGLAVQELGLVDADFVLGIPLSAKGKNIYFDRIWPPRK